MQTFLPPPKCSKTSAGFTQTNELSCAELVVEHNRPHASMLQEVERPLKRLTIVVKGLIIRPCIRETKCLSPCQGTKNIYRNLSVLLSPWRQNPRKKHKIDNNLFLFYHIWWVWLFNNAFSTETVLCPLLGWLINSKLFIRKCSWPNRGTVPKFSRGTEENHERHQNISCSDRDSNHWTRNYTYRSLNLDRSVLNISVSLNLYYNYIGVSIDGVMDSWMNLLTT
jgi:hypothetical protein